MVTLQEVLWMNKNCWWREGGGVSVGGGDASLMGLLLRHCGKLVKLQLCVTVNFLVCALCLQAVVVPPSVKLSPLLPDIRNPPERRQSSRYDHTDWSRRRREDIKGACHAAAHTSFVFPPNLSSFIFFVCLFTRGKVAKWMTFPSVLALAPLAQVHNYLPLKTEHIPIRTDADKWNTMAVLSTNNPSISLNIAILQ